MDYNKYKKDIINIGLILVISSLILSYLLSIDMKLGVYYIHDVYSYLNNGLYFAGLSTSSINHGLPPLIPFLCSLVFRTGYVTDKVILIISGIFYILCGLGFYGLLRIRFNELLSFTGTVILLTFPINIAWVSKGMLDIPGLAMSIWAIYLMVLGLYKNPKYYYLAFPVLILGFFTRYTVILTLPVMLLLIFFTGNPLNYINRHLGKLLKGILMGITTLIGILYIYKINKMPLFFISQSSSISATSNPGAGGQIATSTAAATTNNLMYYLNNIPLYIGTRKWIPYSFKPGAYDFNHMTWLGNYPSILSYIFLGIIIIGLILYIKQILNKHNRKHIKEANTKKAYYLKIVLIIVPLSIFFIGFTKLSIYELIGLLTITILALFRLIRKADLKYMAIDFMFFYWFSVNITFYTYHIIKTDRYAITFMPTMAYLIILGLFLIYNNLKNHNISQKTLNTTKILIPILLIIGSLGYTGYCFAINSPHTFDNQSPQYILTASEDQKEVCEWLINNDSNYLNKTIWADDWSGISFELRCDINKTDHIKNQNNFTEILKENHVDYYISEGRCENITNYYTVIKEKNNCTLYRRI